MKRLMRAFTYSCMLAVLSLVSVALLWRSPLLLAGWLFALGILMVTISGSREDFWVYVLCGLGGALAESFAILFGVWSYSLPAFMGIPIWLPFIWGIAALFVRRVSEEVHEFVGG